MNIDTAVDKLNSATKLIAEAMAIINGLTPSLPKESETFIDQGICLNCRKEFAEGERRIRGVHERCYRRIMRRIETGSITESEAINAGLLSPPGAEKKVVARGDQLDEFEAKRKPTIDPLEMLQESRSHTKEEWAKFLIKKSEELSKKQEKPKRKKEAK